MKKTSGENQEFVEYNLYKKNQETNRVELLLKDNLYFEPTGFIFQKTLIRKQENENTRKYGNTSVTNTVKGFFLEDDECGRVDYEGFSTEEAVNFVLPPAVIKSLLKFGSIEEVKDENGDTKKWNVKDTDTYTTETIAYKFVVGEKFKNLKSGVKAFVLKPVNDVKDGIKRTFVNVNLIYNELEKSDETEEIKEVKELKKKVNKIKEEQGISDEELEELL